MAWRSPAVRYVGKRAMPMFRCGPASERSFRAKGSSSFFCGVKSFPQVRVPLHCNQIITHTCPWWPCWPKAWWFDGPLLLCFDGSSMCHLWAVCTWANSWQMGLSWRACIMKKCSQANYFETDSFGPILDQASCAFRSGSELAALISGWTHLQTCQGMDRKPAKCQHTCQHMSKTHLCQPFVITNHWPWPVVSQTQLPLLPLSACNIPSDQKVHVYIPIANIKHAFTLYWMCLGWSFSSWRQRADATNYWNIKLTWNFKLNDEKLHISYKRKLFTSSGLLSLAPFVRASTASSDTPVSVCWPSWDVGGQVCRQTFEFFLKALHLSSPSKISACFAKLNELAWCLVWE